MEKDKGALELLFSMEGIFLLAILAFRLGFIRELHLQLSPDEAYYWDWSRHLAWGYYSKPPMVAWLIALSTRFLGISEYAVRVPAVLCGMAFLVLFYLFVYRLFGKLPARWALFAAALIPIFTVFGLLMTIDPPLLLFWAGALYAGWKAAEENRWFYWGLLGVFCGLGLLTKQTMLAFGFFYGLWLLVFRKELLRGFGPWLALGLAFLIWAPNLYWIATHHWVTLHHTEHHFKEEGLSLFGPVRFLGEQAGVLSPLLLILFIWVSWQILRRKDWRSEPRLTYLWVLSAWPYLAVLPLSLFRKVNANWPMPFFVAGLALTAGVIFSLRGRGAKWLRLLYVAGVGMALVGTALLYQLPRFPQKFPPSLAGLLFRFYGWKELARVVDSHRRPGEALVTDHRYLASELAFYLPDHPQVYQIPVSPPRTQYHLWGIPRNLCGKPVLWVMKDAHRPPDPRAVPVLRESIPLPGKRKRDFSLWRGFFIMKLCSLSG
ncbi:MAG TPA: glycosyltransferase family 39 protein [Thermosulfurimonas dismutans]|uniref:Glycosyltransferase family 39 protein n=1 Tax=Thermosulfurimonas dismutans TaxID=999894 RepID=A0A7C3CTB7_9BACT|nr:glycosyltransferase family 39 protein [Thermosulfurimonas dismutans]